MQADVLGAQQRVQLEFLVAGCGNGALAQQLDDATEQVGAQVVVHQVHGAHDSQGASVVAGGLAELELALQGKRGARRQGAPGAGSHVQLARRFQRLDLAVDDALALLATGIGIGARGVAARQRGGVAGTGGAHRAVVDGAVIPAAQRNRVRRPARFAAPAVDGIDFHDGAGLRELHAGLGVRLEGAVVVGNDHRVAAQRGAVGVAGVLEKVEQAFFMHQPPDERQVALLVLRGEAALRVDGLVGAVDAPGRVQGALALVRAEYGVEDAEHRHVLEDAAVTALGQGRVPTRSANFSSLFLLDEYPNRLVALVGGKTRIFDNGNSSIKFAQDRPHTTSNTNFASKGT